VPAPYHNEAKGATVLALNELRVEQEQTAESPERELDDIGQRIVAGHARADRGEREWIEGSLDMAAAYYAGRKQFKSDVEFGDFLKRSGLDNHLGKNDRSALIHLGSNITEARKVMEDTESRSYRLIWDAVDDKSRFPSAGKPREPKRTQAEASAESAKAWAELQEEQLRNVERSANFMPEPAAAANSCQSHARSRDEAKIFDRFDSLIFRIRETLAIVDSLKTPVDLSAQESAAAVESLTDALAGICGLLGRVQIANPDEIVDMLVAALPTAVKNVIIKRAAAGPTPPSRTRPRL
jgi:hypothetical protein